MIILYTALADLKIFQNKRVVEQFTFATLSHVSAFLIRLYMVISAYSCRWYTYHLLLVKLCPN